MAKKRELRYKPEQDRFEASKFVEFKVMSVERTKKEAVKLYQDVIIVHFFDFYLKFEKWMSDLIKLHNDIMSVHQKLVECDKALNNPYEFQRIDLMIDAKINLILEMILAKKNEAARMEATRMEAMNALVNASRNGPAAMHFAPSTPPQTICSNSSSKSNSFEPRHNAPHMYSPPTTVSSSSSSGAAAIQQHYMTNREDANNNNLMQHVEGSQLVNLINFKLAQNNVENLMNKYANVFFWRLS